MKLLWTTTELPHPLTNGGRIVNWQLLRHLHARHEVHVAALVHPDQVEAARTAPDYCTRAYVAPHRNRLEMLPAASRRGDVPDDVPDIIGCHTSDEMKAILARVVERERFDAIVCSLLYAIHNLPDPADCVLLQHNVEAAIGERWAAQVSDRPTHAYLTAETRRLRAFEGRMCRAVRHVMTLSPIDAATIAEQFGVAHVSCIGTGVDVEHFSPPSSGGAIEPAAAADLVFVGMMEYPPNVDAASYFCAEILPLIRARRPGTSLALVGRDPSPRVRWLGQHHAGVIVTGTVPDVRPYLWQARVAVVPLRIGGGVRIKIGEAMAARVPVVSTTIGAEGLEIDPPHDIRIADTPRDFADACLDLLEHEDVRRRVAEAAWHRVARSDSWDRTAARIEDILQRQCSSPVLRAAER